MQRSSGSWCRRGDPEYQRKDPGMLQEKRGGTGVIHAGSEGFRPVAPLSILCISLFRNKIHYNVKFVILTILKCAIQWH